MKFSNAFNNNDNIKHFCMHPRIPYHQFLRGITGKLWKAEGNQSGNTHAKCRGGDYNSGGFQGSKNTLGRALMGRSRLAGWL
jgi:hypothetical protein